VEFVPPFAIGRVPVTPVVSERPVAFVSVREVGVPRLGVTRVGLVDNTTEPVPVLVVTPVPPSSTARGEERPEIVPPVIATPDIVPPVIATELAFCVDIVPRPVIAVFGMVVDAVNAPVPFPNTYPVSVAAPVPPEATPRGAESPDIVPPVIATAFAFWVAIDPKPVMSELGMVETVENGLVPLAFRYPAVKVAAPLPPYATPIVPAFHVPAVRVPTPVIPV